jgi:hypothetical protein
VETGGGLEALINVFLTSVPDAGEGQLPAPAAICILHLPLNYNLVITAVQDSLANIIQFNNILSSMSKSLELALTLMKFENISVCRFYPSLVYVISRHWISLNLSHSSICTMALGPTWPVTEMSTRNLPEGKG